MLSKVKAKNIITLLIVLLGLFQCNAQQIVNLSTFGSENEEEKYYKDLYNVRSPYIGTWEWQNGNSIFRIKLWKVDKVEYENGNSPSYYKDVIRGHFEMVRTIAGTLNEEVIYTSQKKFRNSPTDWFPTIWLTANHNQCGGTVFDNSIEGYKQSYIRGSVGLTLISTSNPQQMEWQVSLPQGMYDPNNPQTFNIPTNIILTKKSY